MPPHPYITAINLHSEIFVKIKVYTQRQVLFLSTPDLRLAVIQIGIVEASHQFYRLRRYRTPRNTVHGIITEPASLDKKPSLYISAMRTESMFSPGTAKPVKTILSLQHEARSSEQRLHHTLHFRALVRYFSPKQRGRKLKCPPKVGQKTQ